MVHGFVGILTGDFTQVAIYLKQLRMCGIRMLMHAKSKVTKGAGLIETCMGHDAVGGGKIARCWAGFGFRNPKFR